MRTSEKTKERFMGLKKRRMTPTDRGLPEKRRVGEKNNNFMVSGKRNKCPKREKDCGRCMIFECPEEKT